MDDEKAELNPLFRTIQKGLAAQIPFMLTMGTAKLPSNPSMVPFIEPDPDGLKLLFTATSAAEADLLRQVLVEAEFDVEYVSSTMTGIFGTSGNPCIYVRTGEYGEALAFLRDYFQAAPEAEPEVIASDKDEA
jgi:hypothetical protein